MTTKTITYEQLKEAVKIAFMEDEKIFSLFDPKAKVETLEQLVPDVMGKILTYDSASYKGVYDKEKLIGYFVIENDSLISFGLNVKYRVRKNLRWFFDAIKNNLPKPFFCVLHSRNVRGVRYLIKHGCVINDSNPLQTQLIYI